MFRGDLRALVEAHRVAVLPLDAVVAQGRGRARGYTGAVPDEGVVNGPGPDVPGEATLAEQVDVAALFEALRDEVRRSGVESGAPGARDHALARAEAERLWPVSADRPLRLRPGARGAVGIPVKWVLRKLLRWYVEPLAYDQRSFNAALLRLVDDQEERIRALEAEFAARSDGTDTG
jgi:hypothetical protein